MGRVKSTAIKRTGRRLVEDNPEKFDRDFENNKKTVQELVECEKKTRNKIAGYVTRLKRV